MTTIENAARQAIGTLEIAEGACAHTGFVKMIQDTITDLQAALEEPVNWQEIECPCCGDLARAFPPAPMKTLEQAARMSLEALQLCANGTDDTMLTRDALASLRQALEQPVREWVGLADVEIGDALIDLPVLGNGYFLRIARAIEAALKEKNT